MSGPVWRFESDIKALCDICLAEQTGLFIEGEVHGNSLAPSRRACPECYRHGSALVVSGELGSKVAGPAYARRGYLASTP